MLEKIKQLIAKYEIKREEIKEFWSDEFNPMDASGGNFDDCYYLGMDHGEVFGAIRALFELLKEAE